ncbi:hypothetical protein [Roseburia intestinalis]
MTDFEFLSGIMEARRDSLNHQAETYFASNKEANVNKPKCPTCQSENIQKISAMTKAGSVALWGIFSQKVKSNGIVILVGVNGKGEKKLYEE